MLYGHVTISQYLQLLQLDPEENAIREDKKTRRGEEKREAGSGKREECCLALLDAIWMSRRTPTSPNCVITGPHGVFSSRDTRPAWPSLIRSLVCSLCLYEKTKKRFKTDHLTSPDPALP